MFLMLNIIEAKGGFTLSLLGSRFVRWRRKPRWEPVAKSKLFKFVEKRIAGTEKIELQELHNHYRSQFQSLRSHLQAEFHNSALTSTEDRLVISPHEQDIQNSECALLNSNWNLKNGRARGLRQVANSSRMIQHVEDILHYDSNIQKENSSSQKSTKEYQMNRATLMSTREYIDNAASNLKSYSFSINHIAQMKDRSK